MKAISCLKVADSVKMSEKLLKHTYANCALGFDNFTKCVCHPYKFLSYSGLTWGSESPVYFKTRTEKEHFLIDALMVVRCSKLADAFMPRPICEVLRYVQRYKSDETIDTGHQETLSQL